MMDVFYLGTYVHYFRCKAYKYKNTPFSPGFYAIAFQFRAAEANNFGPEMQA